MMTTTDQSCGKPHLQVPESRMSWVGPRGTATGERWLSVASCRTADSDTFLPVASHSSSSVKYTGPFLLKVEALLVKKDANLAGLALLAVVTCV